MCTFSKVNCDCCEALEVAAEIREAPFDAREMPVAVESAEAASEPRSVSVSHKDVGMGALYRFSRAMRSFQHSDSCALYMLYCFDMDADLAGHRFRFEASVLQQRYAALRQPKREKKGVFF